MEDKTYTLTEEQKEQIGLLLAYSNGVSMALRSPGGRTHSWTLGKIGHLYDQQCKVEQILESLTPDPSPSGDVVERIRETVLQALCDHEDLRKLSDDYEDEDEFITERITPIIEAEAHGDGWIKVTDRLPEWGQQCITWYDGHDHTDVNFYEPGTGHASWFSARGHCCHTWVTHWRPLPPEPREPQ